MIDIYIWAAAIVLFLASCTYLGLQVGALLAEVRR